MLNEYKMSVHRIHHKHPIRRDADNPATSPCPSKLPSEALPYDVTGSSCDGHPLHNMGGRDACRPKGESKGRWQPPYRLMTIRMDRKCKYIFDGRRSVGCAQQIQMRQTQQSLKAIYSIAYAPKRTYFYARGSAYTVPSSWTLAKNGIILPDLCSYP